MLWIYVQSTTRMRLHIGLVCVCVRERETNRFLNWLSVIGESSLCPSLHLLDQTLSWAESATSFAFLFAQTAADHVQDRRAEYHPKGVPCYFNRDCESQQFCVKPDRNVFTSGTCSFVPNFEPARPNERTRDLHFVVHNPRMAREVFLKANLQGQVQPSSAGGTEPRIRTPAGLSKTYVGASTWGVFLLNWSHGHARKVC